MLETDRLIGLIEGLAERVARLEGKRLREGAQLGARLRSELDQREMTIQDLTDRINAQEGPDADVSTLQSIVSGEIENPSEPMIAAIGKALGISQDELFGLIGGRDESPDTGRF